LVVATAGAGGDLQPLVAAALALRGRGHDLHFIGDESVVRSLRPLGLESEVLPSELNLGPRLVAAIREAMTATGGDIVAAGPIVQRRLGDWAEAMAGAVAGPVRVLNPEVIVTSLFGVEVLAVLAPACPWVVVNSTFYLGPRAPRTLAEDIGPRAIPLISRFVELLGSPQLVLHATDPVFDFSFDQLPDRHHYVGPLGIWEPPSEMPEYIAQPGDRWALVTISSQLQDDVPLAQAALQALADQPLRVLVTLGPGHDRGELGALPANAHVEKTVSHAAVLEHGALLVSHAGHGSVMKALWHGQPMVLVPWGRDQPGVAARASALGVAKVLPRDEASPQSLRAAIRAVLGDDTMRRRAQHHAQRLRATDPPETATALIQTLL
jgi:UDP:flavonoid glycosyltransferase YjiC (YdhE family)